MTIRKRKQTGKWEYDVKDSNNKRVRRGNFKTKAEAEIAEREFLFSDKKNIQGVNQDITFKEYYETWQEVHLQKNITQGSKNLYQNALNKFLDYFGEDMKLNRLTRLEFQKFINHYASTRTHESARKLKNNLSRALKDAVYDGYIERTPAYNIDINAAIPEASSDDKFINYADFIKIRDYAINKFEISYFIIYLLIITGARFGEIQKLEAKDIDKENNTIHIRGTKTKKSDRHIIVSNSDIDFIINRLDKYPDKEPLHLSNNAVTKALRHIISVLDIDKEHITLHMIRHTHCSVLLNHGLDIHYVSRRLGHANIGVTLKTYSHLLKERKQEEDKKIENFLEQEWNKV